MAFGEVFESWLKEAHVSRLAPIFIAAGKRLSGQDPWKALIEHGDSAALNWAGGSVTPVKDPR